MPSEPVKAEQPDEPGDEVELPQKSVDAAGEFLGEGGLITMTVMQTSRIPKMKRWIRMM